MTRLPPALAARATAEILTLLPEPPALVLELGFAGIHAEPLRLAGYEVTVVEADAAEREWARARAGEALAEPPSGVTFDAVVAPAGLEAPPTPVLIRVGHDGSVWRSTST